MCRTCAKVTNERRWLEHGVDRVIALKMAGLETSHLLGLVLSVIRAQGYFR